IPRCALNGAAESTQQVRAPGQTHERVVSRDLERVGQRCLREALQASGVCLPGVVGSTRKRALQERVKTSDGEALRALVDLATLSLVVTPALPRTGIE